MFSQQVSWYKVDLDETALGPDIVKLLSGYSGISEPEQPAHIKSIRNEAWQTFPFPCIGQFMFLRLRLSTYSFYPRLLSYLSQAADKDKPPPLFLDLGACLGQEVRKLAFDGVPVSQLFMADRFIGYKTCAARLFRDADGLGDNYMLFDVFAPGSQGLGERCLDGRFSVVALVNVLHLFGYDDQVRICCRVVTELLLQKEEVVIVGSQMAATSKGGPVKLPGAVDDHDGGGGRGRGLIATRDQLDKNELQQIDHDKKAFHMMAKVLLPTEETEVEERKSGEVMKAFDGTAPSKQSKELFAHDVTSFNLFWEDVGKACGGVKFNVNAHMVPMVDEGLGMWERDSKWLVFWVERI
ncbi:hypothetical protein CDEST_13041 [Colletotrichum destructivum]|uniref:Methyltransferase domain-containing protein n=1 Tax=Colletotrichum destructivum TaxID=34406 RepID=A0AAX4IXR6_9PEZI|nr:hypothetical protein CDEST_13041 [Colletotrichum destructivum]